MKEISAFDTKIHKDREKHIQLISLKDRLEAEVEELMAQLSEMREKKYNLESEWNNLRGATMANIFGYAFL